MTTQSQPNTPSEKTRWRNSRRMVILLNALQVAALIVFIIAVTSDLLPTLPDDSIIIASFISWGIIALSGVFALYTAPSFSRGRQLQDLFEEFEEEDEELQLEKEKLRLHVEKLQRELEKTELELEGLRSEKEEALNRKD